MPMYVNPLEHQPLRTDDVQALQQQREAIATKELEKLFASMLVKEMQKSMKTEGLFGSGPEAKLYQDFMDETMTEAIAEGDHFGIARMAEQQMRRDGLLPAKGERPEPLTPGEPIPLAVKGLPLTENDLVPSGKGIPLGGR
jgi:Rod binding domain-containing protein